MKKVLFTILTLAMLVPGTKLSAQGKYGADSAECIKYLSYYSEHYKQKNYDEALPNWRKAYSLCPPQASQNLFIHGATLLKRAISKTRDAQQQKAIVDSLLHLYDQRVQYYPKNAETALNNKGLDMSNYVKNDPQRLYNTYTEIISTLKENTKPSIFVFNLNAAIELYQKGSLTEEDILNIYQTSVEYLNGATPDKADEKEQLEKVKTDVASLLASSGAASCENLISLFTPRYEASPDDLTVVSNIVKMMGSVEGCTSNDLYLNAATSLHKLNPSYTSAYALYKLNSSRGNFDEAVAYMNEAIASSETDDVQDADYYYELAVFCYKSSKAAQAFDHARKAAELNPSIAGKAYLLIGTIWGSAGCGGDEIARRAPYWVAVDYLQKAREADESLAEEANRLINSYRAYFPQTAEAFMYDLTDGNPYTVSCNGLRATTTVRTQK